MGGFLASMFGFFMTIGSYVNTELFMSTMIREMSFIKLRDKSDAKRHGMKTKTTQLSNDRFDIKFNYNDIFSSPIDVLKALKCWKGHHHKHLSEYYYTKAYQKLEQELQIISILKDIRKLKAGVAALIGDDKRAFKKAKEGFINDCTLFQSEDGDSQKFEMKRTLFERFLKTNLTRSALIRGI